MGLLDNANGLTSNTLAIGVGAAALGVATGVGVASIVGASKRRKSKRRKTRNSRKRNSRNKNVRNKRKYYPEPRGKKYSRKKIRMTKNGQPYIITASGKARFISKRSAKSSHRRKGGKY